MIIENLKLYLTASVLLKEERKIELNFKDLKNREENKRIIEKFLKKDKDE